MKYIQTFEQFVNENNSNVNEEKVHKSLIKQISKYTHFALFKDNNKIADGSEYEKDMDKESIAEYMKGDLEDNYPENKFKDFKIVTLKKLKSMGMDPLDKSSWNSYETK